MTSSQSLSRQQTLQGIIYFRTPSCAPMGVSYSRQITLFSALTAIVRTTQGQRAPMKRAPVDWPMRNGYVAFGDSFAAGMGTGKTSTDPCRVGSNNFGDLLYSWTNNPVVQYQQMACSGDTTFGLNRQIDDWLNPQVADLATISMGGNDVGFPELVRYCIITPNILGDNEQQCEVAKTKAKNLMDLSDGTGLQAKLRAAYTKILDKSTRDVSTHEPFNILSRSRKTIWPPLKFDQHVTDICDRTFICT